MIRPAVRGTRLLLPLLLLLPGAAPQENSPENWEVPSIERRNRDLSVSLSGHGEFKNGTVLTARITPQQYRLAGDGTTLVLLGSDFETVSCRAPVENGTFRVRFVTSRNGVHTVEASSLGPGPSPECLRGRLLIFDPATVASRLSSDFQALRNHLQTIRDFLTELEPFPGTDRKENPIPADWEAQANKIRATVRSHADRETSLAAAASLIADVANEICAHVPFGPPRELTGHEGPYAPPETDGKHGFDLPGWRKRLAQTETVALRETLLPALGTVGETLSRLTAENTPARRTADLKTLEATCDYLDRLLAGDLAGNLPEYSPASEVVEIVSETKGHLGILPTQESGRNEAILRTLDRIRKLSQRIAVP